MKSEAAVPVDFAGASRRDRRPKASPGEQLFAGFVAALLALLVFFAVLPVIWMAISAFKSNTEILSPERTLLPREWSVEGFVSLFTFAPFGRYMLNSVIIAGGIAIVQTVTAALGAYAFARISFRGSNLLFAVFLMTLMVPPQVTLIPQFIIASRLGWVDTYHGMIVPQAFTAFGIFLLRQFFLAIPKGLEDAARIDGANRWGVFVRIILPLSGPAIATLLLFAFLAHWNALLWPLVMSTTNATRTVVLGLREFQGQYFTNWDALMAGAIVATAPTIALYLFAQRWFIRGVVLSSGLGGR
jgi:multiple sugar transport system permease protein